MATMGRQNWISALSGKDQDETSSMASLRMSTSRSRGGPTLENKLLTPDGGHAPENTSPQMPRGGGDSHLCSASPPFPPAAGGSLSEVGVLRQELAALQAQVRSVLGLLQLRSRNEEERESRWRANEAQQRAELGMMVQAAREELQQDINFRVAELRSLIGSGASKTDARPADPAVAELVREKSREWERTVKDIDERFREVHRKFEVECEARTSIAEIIEQTQQQEREARANLVMSVEKKLELEREMRVTHLTELERRFQLEHDSRTLHAKEVDRMFQAERSARTSHAAELEKKLDSEREARKLHVMELMGDLKFSGTLRKSDEDTPEKEEIAADSCQVQALIGSLRKECAERERVDAELDAKLQMLSKELSVDSAKAEREELSNEIMELACKLQEECDARVADVRQLVNVVQAECNTRAAEVREISKKVQEERELRSSTLHELTQALQSESVGRGDSIKELARQISAEREKRSSDFQSMMKALQKECDQRAGEVTELATVLQEEREARAQELSEFSTSFQEEHESRLTEVESLAGVLQSELLPHMQALMELTCKARSDDGLSSMMSARKEDEATLGGEPSVDTHATYGPLGPLSNTSSGPWSTASAGIEDDRESDAPSAPPTAP